MIRWSLHLPTNFQVVNRMSFRFEDQKGLAHLIQRIEQTTEKKEYRFYRTHIVMSDVIFVAKLNIHSFSIH
jgi:hypothetical protein